MHDAGNGTCGTALDVRHGTGDRAGSGNASEEGHDEVCDTLAHQFLVGVMAIVGHGVGNSGAQQTFNGAQKRDRQHRAHETAQGGEGQVRNREVGKFLRNVAELAPDRFHGKVEGGDDHRRQDEHDHGAGQMGNPAFPRGAVHRVALGPEHDDEETYECHAEGVGVEGRDV